MEVISMRSDKQRLALTVAAVVGGLALLVAGLVIALGVRSVVAEPGSAPAADPGAPNPGHAWSEIEGHGADANTYWLGTSADQALELWANSARALRLEPNGGAPPNDRPNLIGGYSGNAVLDGAVGATIGGGGESGASNRVADENGTVAGGKNNTAGSCDGDPGSAECITVGGGCSNNASAESATIAGGFGNDVSGLRSTIGGGQNNGNSGNDATIGGGNTNTASNQSTTVSGGANNTASGDQSTVGGGGGNNASGVSSTVGGGDANTAGGGTNATVGGGHGNTASGSDATVGGGNTNTASGFSATVGGGSVNTASASFATIAGGGPSDPEDPNTRNRVTDDYGTIGGGGNNVAGNGGEYSDDAQYATVGGGADNTASAWNATVGGGAANTVTADYATVAGGVGNTASGFVATVAGGYANIASGEGATVGGGKANTASGAFASVPGGHFNAAQGERSFAAGNHAEALDDGAFVWADSSDFDFASTAINEFSARTTGGARFVSAIDGSGNPTAGVQLAAGGGSWTSISDRNLKDNFTPVDGQDVLARLADIPITTWNYKAQDASIRHMGPTAQDFAAAFGLGESETGISTVDADGVALAAIQGLYQLSQEQATRIQALEEENANLQHRLDGLETRVTALEAGGSTAAPAATGAAAGASWLGLTPAWLALGGLVVVGLALVQRRRAGGQR
jgi:hypothetical protein